MALVQAATFTSASSNNIGWYDLPVLARTDVLQATGMALFDNAKQSVRAKYSEEPADVMQGTVARRIYELLPPGRLQGLFQECGSVSRIYKKTELLTEEPDSDYVFEEDEAPNYGSILLEPDKPEDILSMITFAGSPQLVKRLKEIVLDYNDCFRTTLNKEPARIPPMQLKVDESAWRVNRNAGPPRQQSDAKQAEIAKQTSDMLKADVIQPSMAAHYSQVHLTPKPHQPEKWRFCIDFRSLNLVTESIGQWIPNIGQLINRIGAAKPTVFGVLDLTSGYFQAPLHPDSWCLTAFRCCTGIYEWTRVPMGLKGAPAYFQSILVTIVFLGLIYLICELYIDDLIVFATTDDEFCDRLIQVLERSRKYNITFNPRKVKLGLPRVEYVGHVIDSTGITFSQEKVSEVLNFPTPTTIKQVRSFLGLCNYFRDHVRNHSTLDSALRQVVTNYTNKKKFIWTFIWTEEAEKAFRDLQTAIQNLAKLYFTNEDGKVVLETDASDYGVGGYLYYTLPTNPDPKEQFPIAFMSKSLDKTQQRWDTPEKESFAIFLALRKWDHLLRHIHFLLRTDHKNLTYLNFAGSAKVYRWKLAVQGYDFDVEHVPGKENIVADVLSRLCLREHSDDHKTNLELPNIDHVSAIVSDYEKYLNDDGKLDSSYCQIIRNFHNATVLIPYGTTGRETLEIYATTCALLYSSYLSMLSEDESNQTNNPREPVFDICIPNHGGNKRRLDWSTTSRSIWKHLCVGHSRRVFAVDGYNSYSE